MDRSRISLMLILLAVACLSRIIPHPPNFTSVLSVAILSPLLFQNVKQSLICTAFVWLVSDLLLGAHSTLVFTYGSALLIAGLGYYFKASKNLLYFTALSSLLFFAATNFGVWMMTDLYPKTAAGLCACYIAGLPFLMNQILGTLFYGIAILLSVNFVKSPEHSLQ